MTVGRRSSRGVAALLCPVGDENGPFNRPRTIGGLILIGVAAFLVTIDAFSVDYAADLPILTLFLTTGSILLGVEVLRNRLNGG